jgi:hypothetical protein
MLSVLIWLLIVVLVVGIVFWILGLLGLPQPWLNVARAIVGLIFLVWLLTWLLPMARGPLLH